MKKEMTCITCPVGCLLSVEISDLGQIIVSGNSCPRGEVYAKNELTQPSRMVTTTITIKHALHPRLPVVTSAPIPKDKIFDLIKALKTIEVTAPITMNTVIIKSVLGLDVDLIASRTMERLDEKNS